MPKTFHFFDCLSRLCRSSPRLAHVFDCQRGLRRSQAGARRCVTRLANAGYSVLMVALSLEVRHWGKNFAHYVVDSELTEESQPSVVEANRGSACDTYNFASAVLALEAKERKKGPS